jgi:Dolichyl-phosphate-mannose-protein mannosyltransferase
LLVSLPLIAFIILLGVCFTTAGSFRPAFVGAAVIWGAALYGITEALSAVNEFRMAGITAGWLAVTLLSTIWLWRITQGFSHAWRSRILFLWNARPGDDLDIPYGLLAGCALIVTATALIALVCPPNTPDSMYYHMVRVVNWLDHGNISNYPNIYLPQSYMPPWAEYAMAHLFALASGDRFVNCVQWFSMCGCAIGVSWIAKMLGAAPRGQVFAAVICVTIPQGILQSSGSKNDYVAAFWMVCCICFLLAFKDRPSRGAAVIIGISAGLAMLTKGTAYIFLPPIALMWFLSSSKDTRLRFLRLSPLIAILALFLNVHHYMRNFDLCNALVGCPTALGGPNWKFSNDDVTGPVIASNIIRNIALHLGSPSDGWNKKMTVSVW